VYLWEYGKRNEIYCMVGGIEKEKEIEIHYGKRGVVEMS